MKEENKNSNSRTEALEDVLKSYEEQIDKDKRDKLLEDKGFQDIEGELKINSYEEYERLKNEDFTSNDEEIYIIKKREY